MPRILHTADWQIGRLHGGFEPDDAVPLAEARFTAVERVAALARDEAVDAVVVAGDVFDAQAVSPRTIRRLFGALSAFPGPWVMIAGNHDAALSDSVWTHAARLGAVPGHVRPVLQPGVVELAGPRLALLCAPLTQRHTHDDLTAWFDSAATPQGWSRVGLAHGAVQGLLAEDIDSPNPIAADRAERAALDYLALGDWHGARRIDARTWYSGTPEPDRFRDNGPGQVLLVAWERPGDVPDVQPRPVGQYRWQRRSAQLQVPSDLDALVASLAGAAATDVLELDVAGALDLAGHARLREALGRAEARARCLRADLAGLRLSPTAGELAALRADGYVGELVAELHAESSAADAAQAQRAQDALAILADLLAARAGGAAA
jgi:DNA repair exonuclease SbcCD nuclease subunit